PQSLLSRDLRLADKAVRYHEPAYVPALGYFEVDLTVLEPCSQQRSPHLFFHWKAPLLTMVKAFSRAIRAFSFNASPFIPRSSCSRLSSLRSRCCERYR